MVTVLATIWVCPDCMFAHANGVVSDDCQVSPWSQLPDADVAMSDGHDDFSIMPCDACGTELDGERFEFAVFSWGSGEFE